MTFLQPFILSGLAAAALPLVLHLLTLRRLRRIEFSTLTFLKELQRTRIRRLHLRQILLLILRTLLIVFLVMAFARPATEGSLPAGWSAARTSAVLLLDDSYSMTAINEHGEYLKQARDAALGILTALHEDDKATVVLLSESGKASDGEGSAFLRPASLRQTAASLKPSALTRSFEQGLSTAAALLSASQEPNKEVYIVSDLQNGLFPPEGARSKDPLFLPSVQIYLVPIGEKAPQNLSLTGLTFPSAIIDVGRPVPLSVDVSNRSSSGSLTAGVSAFLEGARMDQRSPQVNSGGPQRVELSVSPRETGLASGRVEIEGDDLEFDNSRAFALRLPVGLRVLLVGAAADLRYARLALAARSEVSGAAFQVEAIAPDRWTERSVIDHDVIFYVPGMAERAVARERLRQAGSGGKGIIVIPGESAEAFTETVADLGLPSPVAEPSTAQGVRGLRAFDLRHPVFAGMFDRSSGDGTRSVESADIRRTAGLRAAPSSLVLISLTDGQPFLIEQRYLQARALVFTAALNAEWSDLPLKGLFVPLLHRSVSYLAQEQTICPDFAAGDEAVISVPSRAGARWRVVGPDGQTTSVAVAASLSGATLRFGDTRLPGVYSVFDDRTELDRFSVHIRDEESDTRPVDPERLARFWSRLGLAERQVHRIAAGSDIGSAVQQARFGTELWSFFLAAALIIAVVESLVAARFHPAPTEGPTP